MNGFARLDTYDAASWVTEAEAVQLWARFSDTRRGQTVFFDWLALEWYFCDESHDRLHGPYATEERAHRACRSYSESL